MSAPKVPGDVPLPFDAPVTSLRGIAAKGSHALAESGIRTVADLVWTLPAAWDDLRAPSSIADAIERARAAESEGAALRVCAQGVVKSAGLVPMRGRRAVRVVIADRADPKRTVHAWWFFAAHGILALATPGAAVLVVGRVRVDPPPQPGGRAARPPRMAHPEIVLDEPAARVVRPRYPRVGIGGALLKRAVRESMERLSEIPDPVPAAIAAREKMPEAARMLRILHGIGDGLPPPDPALVRSLTERLAWAEAFTRVRERVRAEETRGEAHAFPRRPDMIERLRVELGFPLTQDQSAAMDDVARDLARDTPMRRLLLGDVGTGKTVVAMAAAAQCVAAGAQVAILAPTSVLAEQYMEAVAPLARASGASIALLAAGVPDAQRKRAASALARGTLSIAIGTHALLSEDVEFAHLGLVVVDEQHRLGVAQRLALVKRGSTKSAKRPHLLTLSATPIPRTLALALRGELPTSILRERPAGRVAVSTELLSRARACRDVLLGAIRAACADGGRVFFVSPRIESPAADDETAGDGDDSLDGAIARAEELRAELAPLTVALIHGGQRADEKRTAMRAFRSGEAQVLVGTTVIEVGVDVPDATLMIVDRAERFGLAQLHQLRGRVGRGSKPGRCLLLHDTPLDALAQRRLDAVCTISDGAELARADLALRGAGDLSGTRQHGLEEGLLFLEPAEAPAWLDRIEADTRAILAMDPGLTAPEHRALSLAVGRLAHNIAVREEAG